SRRNRSAWTASWPTCGVASGRRTRSRCSTRVRGASTRSSGSECASRRASSTTSPSSTTRTGRSSGASAPSSWASSRPRRRSSSWSSSRAGPRGATRGSRVSPRSPPGSRPPIASTARAPDTGSMRSEQIFRIIRAYDDPVVRAYCWLRFGILRQRFLDEIGQYLPRSGEVLDLGCGFGLFSLYYASIAPGRFVRGLDVNGRRIAMARHAAERLAIANVAYRQGDARDVGGDGEYGAAYMLDIVHHVPAASVEPLLRRLHGCLAPGAPLLIKDVDAHPAWKRWFTWTLDRLMDPRTPVRYWPADELEALLERVGFRVHRHPRSISSEGPRAVRGLEEDDSMHTLIRAQGLSEPISHYSDAVVAGRTVYVSGQGAFDVRGRLVGANDVVAQTRQVLENMKTA